MKTPILLSLLVTLSLTGCNNEIPETEIPSVVRNAFNLEFSGATDVEWEKNGSLYEVEFEMNKIDHKALIEETGNMVKYKKELQKEELPENLRTSLTGDHDISKVDEVDLLVMNENSYYQLEFDGLLTDSHKIYNQAGEEMQDVIHFD